MFKDDNTSDATVTVIYPDDEQMEFRVDLSMAVLRKPVEVLPGGILKCTTATRKEIYLAPGQWLQVIVEPDDNRSDWQRRHDEKMARAK